MHVFIHVYIFKYIIKEGQLTVGSLGAVISVCLSVCLSQALELRKRGFWTLNYQANEHKISFKKSKKKKKRYLCMYLLIYLFIYILIYNKEGKTQWRLAGRCPLGVSVCRRHWNCVSVASGH